MSYVENFSQLSLESIKSSILDDLENAASQIIFWTHIGSLLSPNLSLCKKRLEKCLLEAINEVKIQVSQDLECIAPLHIIIQYNAFDTV